ncbi:Rv3654c family TadE-like protein [Nocardia sp. CY41]|uniref:Rv3654c family TadE-like protein n=1 Tax=Nocardia sp. CY41 TaxID=2608686 RepID=UPI002E2ABDDC|nr:Rv3654c family TadE-like protein [Nocardia sp. CY41]
MTGADARYTSACAVDARGGEPGEVGGRSDRAGWRMCLVYGLRVSGDEGVATVFVCLALVALIGVTLLLAQVGVVVVARHRAQAAADMAALAAAGALVEGVDAACAEADGVARWMGTRIRVCEAAEWDATVTVERNVPIGLYGDRVVRASARAGPVEE